MTSACEASVSCSSFSGVFTFFSETVATCPATESTSTGTVWPCFVVTLVSAKAADVSDRRRSEVRRIMGGMGLRNLLRGMTTPPGGFLGFAKKRVNARNAAAAVCAFLACAPPLLLAA